MAPLKTALLGGALVAALVAPTSASAASSKGCDGGGFTISTLADGSTVKPGFKGTVAASRLGTARLHVTGKYVTFDLDPQTFSVYDYTYTSAPNPLSMTNGRNIVAYASKVADLRGSTLTGALDAELDKENLAIGRAGDGVAMKIQAKDC